ncbi:hypothetical protein [Bradyrhizobium sp. USDA 4515]
MAVTENANIEGVLIACDEINASGGINGAAPRAGNCQSGWR